MVRDEKTEELLDGRPSKDLVAVFSRNDAPGSVWAVLVGGVWFLAALGARGARRIMVTEE